jgi:hypothetical protein
VSGGEGRSDGRTRSLPGLIPALSVFVVVVLVGVAVYTATGAAGSSGSAGTAVSAGPPAGFTPQATFAGLEPASGNPELASLNDARPGAGQIVQAAGPFDDRFVLEDLAFDGVTASGVVRVTSDVSDVLDLEVLAGFYDDQGVLLGTERFVHHLVEDGSHTGPPEETQVFSVAVPGSLVGRAVAAAVGIPVLVNE